MLLCSVYVTLADLDEEEEHTESIGTSHTYLAKFFESQVRESIADGSHRFANISIQQKFRLIRHILCYAVILIYSTASTVFKSKLMTNCP